MAYWQVKEFAKLTKVTVRTLHHYDDIDLLKPSGRLPNGYRVYSQDDLLKLQQIAALKFFGFKLVDIKKVLDGPMGHLELFKAQQKILERRVAALKHAKKVLDGMVKEFAAEESVEWQTVINVMEAYHMNNELKQSWLGKQMTEAELKEFSARPMRHFSDSEQAKYDKRCEQVVSKIAEHLEQDPEGDAGKALAKEMLDLMDERFGGDKVWRKRFWQAYKLQNKTNPSEAGFDPTDPRVIEWIERALNAHFPDWV